MRTSGISIVLAFLFALCASAQEDCASCHEERAKTFGKTIHGRASTNCESCHIGAQEHAASGGEKKPADAANACLSCHEAKGRTHWQGSAHQRAGLTCVQCHDPHNDFGGTPGPKSAVGGPGAITQKCLSCHGQMRAALHQRSAHPLRDGQMECSSCHNPHGSSGEKMLKQASVNDLCYTCHQNLRGPFLWEHSPVREDCLTCHRAHGSNYPQLLQARVSQLCQSCHQQGRHQTVPGVAASIWNSNRGCVNCHSQIHGTNHPSGPLFQR
jgi:DmsE family decaheme c-type cytochrome